MSAGHAAWGELDRQRGRPAGTFHADIIGALPEPAGRYLRAAIAESTPLAAGARLRMRGRIKIGRWLPFAARQLLVPRRGTVWQATVASVIRGSDRYVAGSGGMSWKLLGLVPIMRAESDDVIRSSAERAAGESIWVPTAVLADADTRWSTERDDELRVDVTVDTYTVTLHHEIDEAGSLRSSHFERWGDPDNTGTWRQHPFGVEVTGYATFDGVTIPHKGRAGWHFGTDRWSDGVFFEYEIYGYELLRG